MREPGGFPTCVWGLSNSQCLSLDEWPKLRFTTRVERGQFHRARFASRRTTRPSSPSTLAPLPSSGTAPLSGLPARVEQPRHIFSTPKGLAESGATSPEERGPIETQPGRKAETDRVREGISEGFRLAESDRVAPGGEARPLSARPSSPMRVPPRIPRRS
jgi:hypothetical protein